MKKSFLALFLIMSTVAYANTYFVAPTGNNNNSGTISAPWATLSKAFSTALAGDTVFFRGGVYYPANESQLGYIDRDGTIENPICFFNYPSEEPVFDCKNVTADNFTYAIRGNYANYIELRGLTIRNMSQSSSTSVVQAIDFYMGKGVKIERCSAYNIDGVGFGFHGCDELYVSNCDAYNLCDSLQLPVPGQNGTGFACGTGLSYGDSMYDSHSYFDGCRTWNFSDNGFAMGGVGYMEFKNCWAFNGGMMYGDGIGFKFSIGSSSNTINPLSHKIINCISALNGMCGFTPNNLNGTVFNGHYYNNFLYHNGYKPELKHYDSGFGNGIMILNYTGTTSAPNEMFSNNISFDNQRNAVYVGDSYNHEYNSWDQNLTTTTDDFVSLDWEEMLRPRQPDGSLPFINFGKLVSSSDLINAGTNVGLPYNGSAPDLGWHESSFDTNTPPVPSSPGYVSSVIENATPARLEMIYTLTLANILPATSAFTVRVNNVTRSVTSITVSGNKVLLTLASPAVYGDAVSVAYTKPSSNPLQTTSGGQAASVAAQNVTNNVAAITPVFVSSVIENATPSRLEMTYNLTLGNIVPVSSSYTVTVNSSARSVTAVAISNTKVLLTLASPVVYGDVVTVAYTKPASNPLQTTSGGQAASIAAQNVTNNVVAITPVYVSSVIENATPSRLEMTYNLTLSNFVPVSSSFTVTVNSSARSVTAVAISNTKVLLTLSNPVGYGDVVTVAYTKPTSNPLQATSGGQAATLTARSVTNNCSPPTNQPPIVNLSSPTKSTSYISPATITIDAIASDPDGAISKVEFYQGAVKLGERTSAPYTYVWKEVPEGTYTITAAATDNQNLRSVSTPVSVVVEKSSTAVNQLPVVNITTPGNSKKYKKNDIILFEAVASDPDGTIAKVEFKSGSTTLTEMTSAPYTYTWEAVDTGTFMLTVIATDNLGATSASLNMEFIVDLVYDPNSEIINLYPNPNDGHFTIDFLSGFTEPSNIITIVSLAGKTVYNDVLAEGDDTKEIDLSNSAPGTYVFMLKNGQNIVTTKKFIKK